MPPLLCTSVFKKRPWGRTQRPLCHFVLLCNGTFTFKNAHFFPCPLYSQLSWTEVSFVPSLCLCPASPSRPPDVQISPGSTGVFHFKRRCRLRTLLMAAGCEAAGLSEQPERGIIWRQPHRKGLHNESVSANLRLASVIDERFIAACWSATSVTWRRA